MAAQIKLKKEDRIKECLEEMYLTPSQVEELRELGVEFEDSKVVWKISDNHQNIEIRNSIGDWVLNIGAVKWETIDAPSLQEVLEKLPAVLTIREECGDYADNECEIYSLVMNWDYIAKVWYCCYADYGNDALYGADSFCDPNPLLAAFELLKWVATHHPESLTDKTE